MSADSVPWDVQLRSEAVVGLLGDGVRRQREMRWAVRMRARLAEMSDAERKRKGWDVQEGQCNAPAFASMVW
jgi:hypothetical protein